MVQLEASSSLACVVLTTMGRVLLQCERDTTLPFHYPQLALLLASCLQFATSSQEYARLDLQGGYSVVLSVDAPVGIACAVVVKEPQATELARLHSLVVLKEFARVFRKRVDEIVQANRVAAAEMAEAYTLTSALGGGGRGAGGGDGYDDEEGTLEEFLAFHHQIVAQVLESAPHSQPSTSKSDYVTVLQACVLNGESGAHVLGSHVAVCLSAEADSHTCQELVRRAARALHLAFPVMTESGLLQSESAGPRDGTRDSCVVHAATSSALPSPTTLVLHLKTRNSDGPFHYAAIRMLHSGVYASVVYYCTPTLCGHFRGKDCELLAHGRMQRVLASDSRGAAMLRLLHDESRSTCFALHVGSDGVSKTVSEHLEHQLRPWRVQFETERTEN